MGESSSFATSANAFGLPTSTSSSYQRRSYAAALSSNISTSFASMSFQPMSLGTSWSKSQIHSLMQTRSDAELTKGYECCGQKHEGLHALLEHVEDAHPLGDPDVPDAHFAPGFTPVTHAMELDFEGLDHQMPAHQAGDGSTPASTRSSQSPISVPSYPLPPSASKSPTPTDKSPTPLNISDVLASPPESDPTLTAQNALGGSASSSPPENLATPTTSAHPSPVFAAPKINPARPGFLGSTAPRHPAQQKRFDRAFNEVVAGSASTDPDALTTPTAVAPGVLFASAVAGLGIPTTPPINGGPQPEQNVDGEATPDASVAGKVADAQLPQPSLFSMHKPWRCPNPGCNKAYKQSNGLKYHQQKGQCDFAIHDAVDLGLSVEEAEERSRPFVCAVGAGCDKRYRQMNGLKVSRPRLGKVPIDSRQYHYLNSGEHGQYGLRMLQNGTHPHPPSVPPPTKRPMSSNPTTPTSLNPSSTTATPTTNNGNFNSRHTPGAPYAIPNKASAASRPMAVGLRMGTWPTKLAPNKAPPVQLPIQRGRDAVLFAAVGNDPFDVNGRLEI